MAVYYGVNRRIDVRIPMHDGVHVSADIYLPDAPGPFPTVLVRTPYDNSAEAHVNAGKRYASKGYAFVVVDVRGRYDSEGGEYYPYVHEAKDGYDVQQWIGHQPWSTGKIGTRGGSDLALTQWIAAPERSEFLTCMVPRVIGPDQYAHLFWPFGAFQLWVIFSWGLQNSSRVRVLRFAYCSVEYLSGGDVRSRIP